MYHRYLPFVATYKNTRLTSEKSYSTSVHVGIYYLFIMLYENIFINLVSCTSCFYIHTINN